MSFADPPDPPDAGSSLRAKDLKNRVVIFRPVSLGEWPARPATEDEDEKSAAPFVVCDVWELDRSGVVQSATGVRVSWWRVVEQLRTLMGEFVAGKVTENDDRSITLVPLVGEEPRKVAADVVASIDSPVGVPVDEPSDEPF